MPSLLQLLSSTTASFYHLLLLLVFALAGLLLVLILLICNFTVSQGTLSGLIFYANIVQVNRAIFFLLTHKTNLWNQFLQIRFRA